MNNTLLHDLLHYGEVIADYEFEDKGGTYIRIKKIKDIQLTNYIYTIVQINGEYISVSIDMEF